LESPALPRLLFLLLEIQLGVTEIALLQSVGFESFGGQGLEAKVSKCVLFLLWQSVRVILAL